MFFSCQDEPQDAELERKLHCLALPVQESQNEKAEKPVSDLNL